MFKIRLQTWLLLVALGVGLVVTAIAGLFVFISFTATPLHPNADDVPSETRSAPSKQWMAAVAEAQKLVRTDLKEQNLPGLSLAVGIDGDVVWAEGFGFANIETRARVEPNTRFRIGSTSIPLTSAAVGLLLEKDRLKLDDEIQKYVPAYPKKQWPVTLRQLMGHLAGVRSDAGDEEPLSERCEQTVDGLKRFADRPLLFEPGTRFKYSTYGWILVSAAVEAAAGETFLRFMGDQIFEPLGMDDTRPDLATGPTSNRATFYHPRFAADTTYGPELTRDGDYSCFAGAGGFLSTAPDLVRFGLAIINGKLLQPATVTLLQTPQRLASGEESGYALGWDLENVSIAGEPARIAGDDGEFVLGGSTSLMTFPERRLVVAVTTNISFADTAKIALKVADVFAKHGQSRAVR